MQPNPLGPCSDSMLAIELTTAGQRDDRSLSATTFDPAALSTQLSVLA